MATDDLKQTVAIQAASGHAMAEMAKHHGYTYKGMWKLVNTPEVQALIAEQRTHMQQVYTRTWFRYAEHGEALAAGMLEDAFNPQSGKQFEARKYCLDQLSPAKNSMTHSGSIDINLGINAEVLLGLKESIDKISEVRGSAQLSPSEGLASRLREGRTTIPTVDPTSPEDGGAPPVHVRTHNNGDLTHPSTPADLKYNENAQKFNNQGPPDEE